MKKKFNCDCGFHQVQIDFDKLKISNENIISIIICEHRSGHTGKFYKNPKWMGDVVLIGKEAKKFLKFIKEKK